MKTTKENGITLIALVITIIIMIILAGLTMSLSLRNDGIINKSKDAVNIWNSAVQNEMDMLNNLFGEDGTNLEKEYPEITQWIPIYTKEQLKEIGTGKTVEIEGNQYVFAKDGAYILKNDIDLAGENWIPISSKESDCFTGVFLGNNKAIKNMTISEIAQDANSVGLFGYVNGIIANLSLENININFTTQDYMRATGGIVGTINVYPNENKSEIKNCYVTGRINIEEKVSCIGGIIGEIYYGPERTNLYNLLNMVEINSGKEAHVGGIIGELGATSIDIVKCNNKGDIYGNDNNYAGGIIGYIYNANMKLEDCYNAGNIYNENGYSAGIVSFLYGECTINKCYNTGTVSGETGNAGIVASAYSAGNALIENCYNIGEVISKETYSHGIAGQFTGTIKNCYNAGKLAFLNEEWAMGTGIGSGLIEVENCYWYKGESNIDSIIGESATIINNVRELTLEEMKMKESFIGFDFENIWKINEGSSFPTFK